MEEFELESWKRMCLSKKVYHRKSVAERVASQVKDRFGRGMKVYFCPHCSGYHLTSQTKEEQK